MQRLSAVLPLKQEASRTDCFAQAGLLFHSLLRFGNQERFECIHIVTPDRPEDRQGVDNLLDCFGDRLNLQTITDDQLLPSVPAWIRGWRRQQLVKMAIAGRVSPRW